MPNHKRDAIPKSVFAHHIVGNTAAYGPSDWEKDIKLAKVAGIDAFALNIAAQTTYNSVQIKNAYQAAESLNFKLFFSFDYAAQGPWSSSAVVTLLKSYADSPAQFKVNGASFVSTFGGADSSDDWRTIRAAVPIFFLPEWTDVGPDAFKSSKLAITDGFFSWDAWPEGASNKTDNSDMAWKAAVGSKAYMMPVSPSFYTNLPGKNYVWRGDDLWHQRWEQVLQIQPNFVEILTWNDFGESHYIGPIMNASGIPEGAHRYVNNMPHDHWRDVLPYYINAFKTGQALNVTKEKVQVWYRLSPKAAGSDGGTVGNAPWQPPAAATAVVQDKVFFTALVKEPSTVSVQIGSSQAETFHVSEAGMFHASTPFKGRTGEVQV
ncbi:MAG: hypothetical protein Q9170_006442, partial [Blastenia crenularia]